MVDVVSIGANPTRLWGMTNRERTRKIARSISGGDDDGTILVNDDYVVDSLLLDLARDRQQLLVLRDGVPVLAKVGSAEQRASIEASMLGEAPSANTMIEQIEVDDQFTLYNRKLRKRVRPTVERLEPGTVRKIERETYFGAYKGVTDILTKYLWPEWALVLTRVAARIGMSPNQVTTIGLINCIAATYCFWLGRYWLGMALALIFMVLDTVDGKLARCTITSSKWGSRFDHWIDQVHPPFWWLAWLYGLASWGLQLQPALNMYIATLLAGGYVVDRLVERLFIVRHGFHIHVWKKLDSDFRLVGARRNPNMVILFASMLFARPDVGIIAVATWTIISLAFHIVRSIQAEICRSRGETLASWLS